MRADLSPPLALPGSDQPSPLGPRYFRAVARSVGVPEMWEDDAIQDIAFACWRKGNTHPGTIRSAAIDCARRYGPNARTYARPVTVSLIWATHIPAPQAEPLWDLRRALARLTANQRQALKRRINGLPTTPSQNSAVYLARRRLKEELCA